MLIRSGLVCICAFMVATIASLPARADKEADTFSVDDLRDVESERDEAVKRLEELQKSGLNADRELADIDADLIAAAADSRRREEAATIAENRLAELVEEETSARNLLLADQDALEDILATLMTFGSRRPPALATSPEDAGDAVRAAILMGDVAPKLAAKAEALAEELDRIARLQREIRSERSDLERAEQSLLARRQEIEALYAEKRSSRQALAERTALLRARTQKLGAKAENLRDLLDTIVGAAPGAPRLKPAYVKYKPPKKQKKNRKDPPPLAFRGTGQGSGAPLLPVAGELTLRFGEDTVGVSAHKGQTWRTRQGAQVIAPRDARIEYAGPFRTYGQILILDVGEGYLVVLAGLESIYTEVGQQVLSGEPVGRMSDRADPAPELYIEVRHDGQPVDPGRWMGRNA